MNGGYAARNRRGIEGRLIRWLGAYRRLIARRVIIEMRER